MPDLCEMKCEACRAGAPVLEPDEIRALKPQVSEWEIAEANGIKRLRRTYKFPDFAKALAFTVQLGALAEAEGHHPTIVTRWGRVTVTWWTHKIKGLHKNDFIMAARTDLLNKGEEMDIFEYAIRMERDGEAYYRDLCGRTADKGLQEILTMLADAEAGHARILEQMSRDTPAQAARSRILAGVKNVFARMKKESRAADLKASQADMYRKAQDLEAKSRDFYREKAAQAESPSHKDIFNRLAEEEQEHYNVLDNIVEMVSRPEPGQWLEDAEWRHLDEY